MTQCTWQDPPDQRCEETATHPQTTKSGRVWADLCEKHNAELQESLKPEADIKYMLQCWVRASGGAEKMAERM